MSIRFAFWAALAVVIFAVAWPFLALAQTGDTVVTGQPIINLIVQYAQAALAVILPFVVALAAVWFKQKTGIDIDKGLRDGFQTSATNAAGLLIQRLGARAATMTHLDVGNPEVAKVVQMVMDSVPDAVAKFKITPDAVAKRIEAKLGILTGVTDPTGKPVGAAVAVPGITR